LKFSFDIGDQVEYGTLTGIVHDILYDPEELKRKYPNIYGWLHYINVERGGMSEVDFAARFPLVLLDIGGPRFYFIFADEFRRVKRSGIDWRREVEGLFLEADRYKFFVHRTRRRNLEGILRNGLRPTSMSFKGLEHIGKPVVFFFGNEDFEFSLLDYVSGEPDDILVVARKYRSILHLLKVLYDEEILDYRLWLKFKNFLFIARWFVSFEVVPSLEIVIIYDLEGNEIDF
jgi:hypothetical protein